MALIRFDINTVRPTDTGSALGQIWLELPGRAIPCPRWDDFIVFVLDWWRRGIEDILKGEAAPTQFAFMDGSYDVYAVKSGAGFMFRSTFRDEEIFSGLVDEVGIKEFVASYFAVVRAVTERITREPQWRRNYSGSAGTLDDIIEAQPRLDALLAKYR
jgi:hypothetical protein